MIRQLGWRWVAFRAGYALRQKSGLLKRRFPLVSINNLSLSRLVRQGVPTEDNAFRNYRESNPAKFFFDPGDLPDASTLTRLAGEMGYRRILAIADDYCRGRFLYYSHHVFDLGSPPNWLLNPFTGGQHDNRTHWCDYPTFSTKLGDIKDVWEPSRFACAFWLVRAYAITRNERYPAAFWALFESWCEQNPPNLGPNWKCGQEAALRTMAWCFALYGFWRSESTTAARVAQMIKAIALHADRIAGNISYAVSQKNNHGLSEATGLLTVGLLFPELRNAIHWESLSRRILEREIQRQIYDDGGYVQHSMNYHRVMLHDCLWAIRLAELNGRPLSAAATERVAKAAEFLWEMSDAQSGRVPNYGANDGAMVLPLAAGDYTDFRQTIQAANYQATRKLVLKSGPWDEMLVWLFGTHALSAQRSKAMPKSRRFDSGGYYTLRGSNSWCMIRCHSYRDRPIHVDMLHVDLWYRGVNVLGDSGSYKYFSADAPALERYFKDIRAHSTIEIDGAGPLDLVSRFMWLPWPSAETMEHQQLRWKGEHSAYNRSPWNISHRRSVELTDDDQCIVEDELIGTGEHDIVLRWHLADGPCKLSETAPLSAELSFSGGKMLLSVEGPESIRMECKRGVQEGKNVGGWISDYYAILAARPTLEIRARLQLPVRLKTLIRLGSSRLNVEDCPTSVLPTA